MNGRKANIKDIAQATDLSITTVSRVLNGKAKQFRISEKSQKKILEAAKKLKYIPNQTAVNLQSGRTKTISLIIPSLANPFFSKIAGQVNTELHQKGYVTLISDSNESTSVEEKELEQIVSRNVEGVIIVPCGKKWRHIKSVQDLGIPIICVDRYFDDIDVPYVSTDNYRGAYIAARHFIENGHTNIACIQGVQNSLPNKLRIRGFKDALKEAGIESYSITGYDFSVQNGYTETLLLMQDKVKPTAIFSFSNTIALGCIKALKENNINVPEDVSIITFDDHPYLDYLSTPLTCIAQPIEDMCQIAIRLLFSKIQNEKLKTSQVVLMPKIKFRESVSRIN
jgi:LacI family transcriptional regulator